MTNRTIVIIFVCLIAILIVVFPQCGGVKEEKIAWQEFDNGISLASTQQKYVLMDVYTTWCGWCKKMDSEVYTNEEVSSLIADRFIPIKLDAEGHKTVHFKGNTYTERELASFLGVEGYPTTVILSPTQDVTTLEAGYFEPGKFVKFLKYHTKDK
jgi:thioredoxin-related protein